MEKRRDTGRYYLTFKRIKIRYKELTDLTYFNHPFAMDTKIRLEDDIHLDKPLSESSLSTDFDGVDLSSKAGKRNTVNRELLDENQDLFDFSKHINSNK